MSTQQPFWPESDVIEIGSLRLSVTDRPWQLARENAAEISAHFARRKATNPAFFDGQVFVLRELRHENGGMEAELSLERFSAFLYWRDGLGHDPQTLDGFGSALVRSAEGHILAVRAAPGTLNAGRVYLPGGFIDARDARDDGTIDIDASIARELAEETGLDANGLHRTPGYFVVRSGRHCCFAIAFQSPLAATELRDLMAEGAARDLDREIAEVVVIRNAHDVAQNQVLPHAERLITSLLSAQA